MSDRDCRTLLLVDSGASMLLYLSMLLRRLEYKVVTARSAEDALRIMETNVPFIILTELVLPKMSGMQFLKHLKDTGATFDLVLRAPTSTQLFSLTPVTDEYLIERYQLGTPTQR